MVNTNVTKRSELASVESWVDSSAGVVFHGATSPAVAEEAHTSSVLYATDSGATLILSLIADRRGFSYIVKGGQSFYVIDESEIYAYMLGPGILQIRPSFFRKPTGSKGFDDVIVPFLLEVDDSKLVNDNAKAILIDLRPGVPYQFWTRESSGSSQGVQPTIKSIAMKDSLLELDLLSDGAKYHGVFVIDIKVMQCIKTVINGRAMGE